MATQRNQDFGKFLTDLAQNADPINKAALNELKVELTRERQVKIQGMLRDIFDKINEKVESVRTHRNYEKLLLADIKRLEERANQIVSGKY